MRTLSVYFSLFLLILMSFTVLLTGCTKKPVENESNKDRLIVYSTVYPLQYFTERIGGNSVIVKTIYPPGADEHTFEPTQRDMMNIADSDLFVYIGLGLEGFVEKAKSTLKNQNVTFLSVGENIHLEPVTHKHEHSDSGHGDSDVDPHIWLDPVYSIEMVQAIEKKLISLNPNRKNEFIKNSKQLQDDLTNLNLQFEGTIRKAKSKEIVVSHAAYGYWENRYGIEQISIAGLTTSSEPTQRELKDLIIKARNYNIKYVFFEQNFNSKLTEAIQKEIGAKPLFLHNLSTLTNSDLKENRNYFSIMNDNLSALKKALND